MGVHYYEVRLFYFINYLNVLFSFKQGGIQVQQDEGLSPSAENTSEKSAEQFKDNNCYVKVEEAEGADKCEAGKVCLSSATYAATPGCNVKYKVLLNSPSEVLGAAHYQLAFKIDGQAGDIGVERLFLTEKATQTAVIDDQRSDYLAVEHSLLKVLKNQSAGPYGDDEEETDPPAPNPVDPPQHIVGLELLSLNIPVKEPLEN